MQKKYNTNNLLNKIPISLFYNNQEIKTSLPQEGFKGIFELQFSKTQNLPEQLFEEAVQNPIGNPLNPFYQKINNLNISIAISDTFRYTGLEQFIKVMMDKLFACGASPEKLKFLVSVGSHRPPTETELQSLLTPEIYNTFKQNIFIPKPDNLEQYEYLGKTKRGTPVYIFKEVINSDLIILTGTILYHYFAGFGGGRKLIVPGLSALPTIRHNHALSIHPEKCEIHPDVRLGKLEGNPVAEDLMEATLLTQKNYFIVNTVLSPDKKILKIFCGDLIKAHLTGAEFAKKVYSISVPEFADIVIASAGDAKNFLQSHKALVNAWQARKKPYGKIIFIAPCIEGLGGYQFQKWLEIGNPEQLVTHLRNNGEVNGQTVISTLEKSPHTYFLTEMDEKRVNLLGGTKISSIEEGFQLAREELKKVGISKPSWIFLPHASYSVPYISGEK